MERFEKLLRPSTRDIGGFRETALRELDIHFRCGSSGLALASGDIWSLESPDALEEIRHAV